MKRLVVLVLLERTQYALTSSKYYPVGGPSSHPRPIVNTQQGNLRLCPNAKLAANSRKTHPEDVVTLGASPRYLQALRAPHDFALLRLLGCLWQLMIQQT